MKVRRGMIAALLVISSGGTVAQPPAPEHPSGWVAKAAVTARQEMIATANPHATQAGMQMLARGGSAVDAAIAAQLVLGLVEPQSSGLGGGAFLLFHDARRKRLIAYDGRETAPASAQPDRFLKDGKPLEFHEAVVGGRAVGVPGTVRLLETAHRRHGKLRWAELFAPAIALAEQGFAVSPRLHTLIGLEKYLTQPRARAYFHDDNGKALRVGTVLRNPAYAATLRAIAAGGAHAFYTGAIARDIVDTANGHPWNPGRPDARGSRALPGRGARAGVRTLSPLPRVRLSAAILWRHHGTADPGDARVVRRGRHGAGDVLERALHERGRAPRVCGPQRVRGRSRVLRATCGIARSGVPSGARRADPFGYVIGTRTAGGSTATQCDAAARGVRHRCVARTAVDDTPVGGRSRRQCGGDDVDHRGCIRQPSHDAGWVPAQQRTDGFFVRAERGRQAGGQSCRSGKATTLVDGADDRVRCVRTASPS